MILSRNIVRTGNALAVRIPAVIAEHLDLRAGTTVDLDVKRGGFFVRKKETLTLDDLLASVPPGHKEALALDDEARGRELP